MSEEKRALEAFLKAYGSQDSHTRGLDEAAELARRVLNDHNGDHFRLE